MWGRLLGKHCLVFGVFSKPGRPCVWCGDPQVYSLGNNRCISLRRYFFSITIHRLLAVYVAKSTTHATIGGYTLFAKESCSDCRGSWGAELASIVSILPYPISFNRMQPRGHGFVSRDSFPSSTKSVFRWASGSVHVSEISCMSSRGADQSRTQIPISVLMEDFRFFQCLYERGWQKRKWYISAHAWRVQR